MKIIIQKIQIFAVALMVFLPISTFASESGDWWDSGSYYDNSWYDSGSYYSNNWYDSGSYYDNSWYDSGSYYDNSWYDSGSYYSNNWYDSGSYYDNSWYDSGSYYDNSWYDSGSYYSNNWYDSGSYYDNSWYDSGSYYDNSWYDSGSYYSNNWGDIDYFTDYYNYSGCGNDCYDYGYGYDYDYGYDYGYDYDYDYCDYHDCDNNNNYTKINVTCSVSDRTIEKGDSVTFTAHAKGGRGSYTYVWSDDVSGNTKSITKIFNAEGAYYAKVKVTDERGQTAIANCGSVRVEEEIPRYDSLDVSCTVSDRTIEEGDSVTYTADADGGRGSYTYRWYGDTSGSARSITQRYSNSGVYSAYVRVTDQDGRSAVANCDSVRVEEEENHNEDFDVTCKVSDTSIEEGDSVRFTAEVDGGDSPFEYDWSGDVDENDRSFTKRFTRSGRYEVELRVRDDEGKVARDTCPIIRVDDENNDRDDDDRDVNVYTGTLSSGRGNLAGVSSVYLNQIPYTGPEDVAKGIAFVVGILVWSIIAALIIRNRMNKKAVSNRIAAFKEANKATRI
jgi:hypothetical protein